jgi:hypothetical protein
MRLTIVVDDKSVSVDELFFAPLDLSQLDANIHAVQWYGEYGEVEYKTKFENGALVKPANLLITDITPYQFAIDAWDSAKAAAEAAENQSNQQQETSQNDGV